MPWMLAAGAIAGLASSGIGAASASSARGDAMSEIDQSIKQYEDLGVPSIEAQQLVLQQYKSAGKLTPELEQAFEQKQSGLNDVGANAQDREAQLNALNSLSQIGSNGGELLSDKATQLQELSNIAAQNRGRQGAILQNANSRGQLGSGASLAAGLEAEQGASNQAQQTGLTINGQAQQRALQALQGAGQQAGAMGDQDYKMAANRAQANDAINNFNTRQRQAAANQNTAYQNSAQQFNLQNAQNIDNANTSLENQQQIYNKGLIQKQYENQMQKASAEANARAGAANQFNANANNTQNVFAGIGSSLNKAGSTAAGYSMMNDYLNQQKGNANGGATGANAGVDVGEEDPSEGYY